MLITYTQTMQSFNDGFDDDDGKKQQPFYLLLGMFWNEFKILAKKRK